MITVPPAVYGALYEATLFSEHGIELGEGPADGVALALVAQSIARVAVFVYVCAWINTVCSLELILEAVRINRLDVATDSVLQFDSFPRVFERNPLYAVLVLANHQRRGRRNRTRRSSHWI